MGFIRIIAVVLLLVMPVQASIVCGVRSFMVETLARTYNETFQGAGFESSTTVIELWTSKYSPYTWTILSTNSDGVACIIKKGTYWRGPKGKKT